MTTDFCGVVYLKLLSASFLGLCPIIIWKHRWTTWIYNIYIEVSLMVRVSPTWLVPGLTQLSPKLSSPHTHGEQIR